MKKLDYEKDVVPFLAQYEAGILAEQTEVDFVLDKDKFDPTKTMYCFYGQVFGNSKSTEALEFKKTHDIKPVSSIKPLAFFSQLTFLELFLFNLWVDNKREQVYRIIETFATWEKKEVTPSENLFTYAQ